MIIAIPTYSRVKVIQKKTLNFLENQDIPKEFIKIFVANKEEKEAYEIEIKGYEIIIGVIGLANQLNFIYSYYNKDDFIFRIDDDVADIVYLDKSSINLKSFLIQAEKTMRKEKINYGGFYPIYNKMFMENSKPIETKLKHIVGACNFFINSDFRHIVEGGELHKEDYEKTLYHYKRDAKVLRYNHFGIKTTYYLKTGGLASSRTYENEKRGAEILRSLYPEWVSLFIRKGRTQIKLKEKK